MKKLVMVVLLAFPLAAQDTRIDHFGANWPTIQAACAPYTPHTPATLDDRLKGLHPQSGTPDSALRETGCLESLAYIREATDWLDHVRPSVHAAPALSALVGQLTRRPGDSLAAEVLAALSLDLLVGPWRDNLTPSDRVVRPGVQQAPAVGYLIALRQQVADRIYAAVQSGVTTPLLLRTCVQMELAVGDAATMRVCSAQALAQGVDSSWHFIRQSWLASIRHDTSDAVDYMDVAIGAAHDEHAHGEVAWYVPRLVHTPRTAHEYPEGLLRAERDPGFLGDIFRLCPIWSEQNGYEDRAPTLNMCLTRSGPADDRIGLTSQLYRLWDPASGRPLNLFTFGIDRGDIEVHKSGNAHVATVGVNLRQLDWSTGIWTDSTIPAMVLHAGPEADGAHISGVFLGDPAPGPSSWSLAVTQNTHYGRRSNDGNSPLAPTPTALSDLVPGVVSQGLTWQLGRDTVVLAPLNTISVHEPMELFYQVRNGEGRANLTNAVLLHRIVEGQIVKEPVLTVRFTTAALGGVFSVQREIGLSRVTPGDYQLEVQILDEQGRLVTRRATNVFLR